MHLRRNNIFRMCVAGIGLVSLGSGAVTAQTTSTTSPPSQQWSSRIVDTGDLGTTTVPGTSRTATSVPTAKAVRKRVTTTTAATTSIPSGSGDATAQVVTASPNNSIAPEVWRALRECESHNRYDLNTGNGYYGAYQFKLGTWQNLGFSGYPHQATPAVQDEAARVLQAKLGWGQWGECSRRIGVR